MFGSAYNAYEMRGCVTLGGGGSRAPTGHKLSSTAGSRGSRASLDNPRSQSAVVSGRRVSGQLSSNGPTRTSQSRLTNGRAKTSSASHTGRVSAEMAAQMEEMTQELIDMRLSIEGLEKERDFYFGKLRDIEVVIQESSESSDPLASKILEVLYATEEGFAVPDEDEAGQDHDF